MSASARAAEVTIGAAADDLASFTDYLSHLEASATLATMQGQGETCSANPPLSAMAAELEQSLGSPHATAKRDVLIDAATGSGKSKWLPSAIARSRPGRLLVLTPSSVDVRAMCEDAWGQVGVEARQHGAWQEELWW